MKPPAASVQRGASGPASPVYVMVPVDASNSSVAAVATSAAANPTMAAASTPHAGTCFRNVLVFIASAPGECGLRALLGEAADATRWAPPSRELVGRAARCGRSRLVQR